MTGLELTLYSGVPFNNKYKDVLLVSRETRETFLSTYSIGNSFNVNRFEIINDTEAIIDITNAFNGFECNYAKVHTTLTPETTLQTTERDAFYFVNSARQIATNVVRLTLEKDVFQTDFNKYDYQKQEYVLPLIKNGRCILTGNQEDFDIKEKMTLTQLSNSNVAYSTTPLFEKSENLTKVYAVMHYVDDTGEFVAISKNVMSIYDNSSDAAPYSLTSLLSSIYKKDNFIVNSASKSINVLNLYLIPQEYLQNLNTDNLATGAYSYNIAGHTTLVEYWVTENIFGTPETKIHYKYKYIDVEEYQKTMVGTYSHQIELEKNGQNQLIGIRFVFASSFQMLLIANNQIIDIAQDFEYSVFESEFGAYLTNNKNGLAIKGISNALNLLSSGVGLGTGNSTALLGFGKTITNIAGDIADFADLRDKPLKIQTESNAHANIYLLNGVGLFKWDALNKDEIEKNSKYYGYKVDYLTNFTFKHKELIKYNRQISSYPRPVYEQYKVNFDYLQFANLELIAYLPENTKRTIEEMFLNGVRIWYEKDKFLTTFERETIITE